MHEWVSSVKNGKVDIEKITKVNKTVAVDWSVSLITCATNFLSLATRFINLSASISFDLFANYGPTPEFCLSTHVVMLRF